MIRFCILMALITTFTACSNNPELETGEIKTFKLIKAAIDRNNNKSPFPDARKILTREKIDGSGLPVLFVELNSGQNGTLTPYPGHGVELTWLGADGATIAFKQGVLIASRGMGDDLMGSETLIPSWSKIYDVSNYKRRLIYLDGDNKTYSLTFDCQIKKMEQKEKIKIWDLYFKVQPFEEECFSKERRITNTYYIDNRAIVRKSKQYHGPTIGYITTERIDR